VDQERDMVEATNERRNAPCLRLALLQFLAAATLLADGTLLGTIAGRVLDEDGKGLLGATVEVVSADKGFERSLVTGATGAFTLPLLQPGPYTVRVSLSGFQAFESRDTIVTPDKTTWVNVTLRLAGATEAVTVTGEPPLVDKMNTTATTRVDSTLAQKLAVGRSYLALITFAPGVTTANRNQNPNSHGALASNNLYLFDGVDTTDIASGTFRQNFNFEAIQEVLVSTTGISAEYGRAQGAYVNVITRSGTNQLHGSFQAILTNDSWNSQNKGTNPLSGEPWARVKADVLNDRNAATLGGPIWQDHIWFFGAYEWVTNTAAAQQTATSSLYPGYTGKSYTPVVNVRLWDGKLSGQITPSQLLVAQFNSDPITGLITDYWGQYIAPSADLGALTSEGQNQCAGVGCLGGLHWSGVFGSRVSAEAGWARTGGNITVAPYSGFGTPFYSDADQLFYNGATFVGSVFRPRTQANLAGSLYHELFGKAAQLKLGVDYQILTSDADYNYPTNQQYHMAEYNPSLGPNNQAFQVGDEWLVFDPQPSTSRGKIWGFYGLEKFEAGRLSMNLGVRVDYQTTESDIGRTVVHATTTSPRLSAAWNVTGDGKTLVSAGFGTYYQFIIQDLVNGVYSGVSVLGNWNIYLWDGAKWVFDRPVVIVDGNDQPVNSNLKPSYENQYSIAVQRQIGNTMAVGIRGIYNKWYKLIDDVKTYVGDQLILTPRNFPDTMAHRSYKAIELTFEKRFGGNWQALANYTLGRTYGNQFDNYASQLFDFPGSPCEVPNANGVGTFTLGCAVAAGTNQNGIAPYDRTSVANVYVAYTWNLPMVNITAAPSGTLASGLPYNEQRSFEFPDGSLAAYYYTPVGSSRLPTSYTLNFALEATFKPFGQGSFWLVGGPIEIGVKGEVFNLTNQQQVVNQDINQTPGPTYGLPRSRNALQSPRSFQLTGLVRF
jgi:Carboxypeptidase regulatory-like domain